MEDDMGAAGEDIKYSEAPVEVALRPSRTGVAAIAAMALATAVVAFFAGGAVAARVLAATWAACLALEAIHRVALHRGARGVTRLSVHRSGDIDVVNRAGIWRSGRVSYGCFVAPWLTVVRWRPHGARFDRAVVVLPDMIRDDDFRRLRVLLRWA
jgi:toxin CptA